MSSSGFASSTTKSASLRAVMVPTLVKPSISAALRVDATITCAGVMPLATISAISSCAAHGIGPSVPRAILIPFAFSLPAPVTLLPAVRKRIRVQNGLEDAALRAQVDRALDATGPEAALRALVAGPTPAEVAAGLGTEIPAETTVRWVEVAGDEITVDLSGPFELGGGSLSMFLRIGEVVFTATQFEGIDVVRFRIDGMPVDMIGGEGLMVDHATRLQFADAVAPMILLESPLPGASFVEPIHLRGMSNTFEAVVNYQVLDAGGRVILESRCMATSGTGTWGTFDCVVEPLPQGTSAPVTLRVFEYSAMDGAPINAVEVTLD